MKVKVLAITLLFILICGSVGVARESKSDDDARLTAAALWGPPAYAAKYANADGPWIYEVGFQSMFGGRIAVGRGASWQEAFDVAKKAIERGPAPPMGQ